MTELLLDPNIRVWVFLPIVIITFLVGIVRHYVSIILSSQKKIELLQVQDSQVMIRARLLRENGKYLPRQSFAMRRHWFNNEDTGYFKVQKRAAASQVCTLAAVALEIKISLKMVKLDKKAQRPNISNKRDLSDIRTR
ncbi:Transmembrane protein 111 [Papilio machaon]|uniref:ER membrane protein complex subunit 3 n=1 Tax=Papilio machaon TaxID=76193 RepID=A0A0N1IJN0_PAPMA|nr:Transmembrane protein 111 [Papilio machaon]